MPFTFKTEKPTGRYSSFFPTTVYIKLKKKEVGTIYENTSIRLMICKEPTTADPAPFYWITLAKKSESVEAAKEFLNANFDAIIKKYDLHSLVD